jgi:hypothetical protein
MLINKHAQNGVYSHSNSQGPQSSQFIERLEESFVLRVTHIIKDALQRVGGRSHKKFGSSIKSIASVEILKYMRCHELPYGNLLTCKSKGSPVRAQFSRISSSLCKWRSKVSRSDSRSFSKKGRATVRWCFHCTPSVVKIPSPQNYPLISVHLRGVEHRTQTDSNMS